MEEIAPKLPKDPTDDRGVRYDRDCNESCRPEPSSMLSSKEVRRQLGWFLTSDYRERD